MDIKGLNKVISNLENIKNSLYQVNELFIDLSFDYIINYANNLLDKRLKNEYLPEHGLGIRVVKQIAKRYHYQVTFQSESGSYFACDILLWKKKKQIIM